MTVTAATAVVLILTRDPHVAWFSAGALGSSLTGTLDLFSTTPLRG